MVELTSQNPFIITPGKGASEGTSEGSSLVTPGGSVSSKSPAAGGSPKVSPAGAEAGKAAEKGDEKAPSPKTPKGSPEGSPANPEKPLSYSPTYPRSDESTGAEHDCPVL